MTQSDRVSVEDAYAEALVEIARLQERVILGRALIASLKREVEKNGQKDAGNAGHASGGNSPHHFSD